MNRRIKRITAAILTLCLCIVPFHYVSAANEIMPLYNNVGYADTTVSISDTGLMTITYRYSGDPMVMTKAVITTYIEKQTLGVFWSRIDIGKPDNEWVDTIAQYSYHYSRTFQLPSTGTYRVTVTYKISGLGGDPDIITHVIKKSY